MNMRKVVFFALVICSIDYSYAVTHSLHYVYTGISGIPNFPELVSVGLVDGEQIDYYDSVTHRVTPRQQWMAEGEGPEYWEHGTELLTGTEPVFKSNIEEAKQRFNQTGGVHTFQMIYGCEWDDETGTKNAYEQYGYDGSDFIVLDVERMRYIAPVPQAVPTKQKHEHDRTETDYDKNYFTDECIYWLKKYISYGKNMLERTDPPQVSLLQKDPSSPVTCPATGFFPKRIMVTWMKDGENVLYDVEVGETVPNGDGTFQTSSQLSVKPEDWKSHRYTCVVQHKSSTKDVVVRLSEENIKTNYRGGVSLAIIISCVALVLAVAAVVIGVVVWKRSRTGYGKTSTSDTDSENSGQQAQRA